MAKRKYNLSIGFWQAPPQQIIREGVSLGYHNCNNIDYVDANICHYTNLLKQVETQSHIILRKELDEEFRNGLIQHLHTQYKQDIKRNLINLINLSFSEN